MAITPADIEQQTFSPSKHGYDTEEVDAFLEQISSEVDAMLQKIADLKGRLNNTEQQLAAANAQIASLEENAGATQLLQQCGRSHLQFICKLGNGITRHAFLSFPKTSAAR